MSDFEVAFKHLVGAEGGYNNVEFDYGGETKYGISKRSYPDLDIANLTLEEAKEIYRNDWWLKYSYDKILDSEFATKIFMMAVNLGSYKAHKILQTVLKKWGHNIEIDGMFGPATLNMLNGAVGTSDKRKEWFLDLINIELIKRYVGICNSDRTQTKFLLGWINRALV